MRPTRSIPSLSLCSFPVSLPAMLLSSLFPSPWNHTHCSPLLPSVFPLLYSASILFRPPLSFNQGCFLRVPSASCSLHPTPSLSIPPFFRPRELQKLGAGIKPIRQI